MNKQDWVLIGSLVWVAAWAFWAGRRSRGDDEYHACVELMKQRNAARDLARKLVNSCLSSSSREEYRKRYDWLND